MTSWVCRVRDQDVACDEYRWDEVDARGIYLCRVCHRCRDAKLSVYRPEVLTNPRYSHDEALYPDQDPYTFQVDDR